MKKKLLLASAALSSAIACGGKKKEPIIYSNPKGGLYDKGLADAGVDAAPTDAVVIAPPDDTEIYANPKGALYDDGIAKPPAK